MLLKAKVEINLMDYDEINLMDYNECLLTEINLIYCDNYALREINLMGTFLTLPRLSMLNDFDVTILSETDADDLI